jgi:hypothetical protein
MGKCGALNHHQQGERQSSFDMFELIAGRSWFYLTQATNVRCLTGKMQPSLKDFESLTIGPVIPHRRYHCSLIKWRS